MSDWFLNRGASTAITTPTAGHAGRSERWPAQSAGSRVHGLLYRRQGETVVLFPPSLPSPLSPVRWHPHRPLCRRRHLQDSDWILGERAIGAVEPPSEEDDDPLAQVDIHQVCVFAFTSLSFTLCVHREGSQLLSLHRVTVYTPSMRRG